MCNVADKNLHLVPSEVADVTSNAHREPHVSFKTFTQHNAPLDHFLLNSDYVHVKQELHMVPVVPDTSAKDISKTRETVCAFAVVPLVASDNNKNGLQTSSVTSAGSAPNGATEATGSNDIPTCNDSDNTICIYLDKAFPTYRTVNIVDNTFEPCASSFSDYEKFPTFKTSYRNVKNENIQYTSGRPDWEPYNWFFSQIR